MNLSFGNFGYRGRFSGNLFKRISTDIEVYRVGKEVERQKEKEEQNRKEMENTLNSR